MNTSDTAIRYTGEHEIELAKRWESLSPDVVHSPLIPYLPKPGSDVLDVGAGSGRDARWLAGRGYSVVAVEPSTAMRIRGADYSRGIAIEWVDDRLPLLPKVCLRDEQFDLLVICAVMMFVQKGDWHQSLVTIKRLSSPGAILAASFLLSAGDTARGMVPVQESDVEQFVDNFAGDLLAHHDSKDLLGRSGFRWVYVVLKSEV